MSLSSVLQTALSGMDASTLMLDVASNNLANSRTTGFKASEPQFATQPSGAGVKLATIDSNFSQGTIAASSNPLDLALQGDGMFIVEGSSGGSAFTRAGNFHLNANGEIVTSAGQRVLGNGVDGQFQIEQGQLQPVSISLGSKTKSADGSAATLTGFSISNDGRIIGTYSDGMDRTLGQIRVARVANPSGLEGSGDSLHRAGVNSGLPTESNPGTGGSASLMSGATELSNTNVGQSVIDTVLASHSLRANATVFTTSSSLMDELSSLRRTNG
jgi:flagellar hook protein FlgE